MHQPIPNHCTDCDKPINNTDNWVCSKCNSYEEE